MVIDAVEQEGLPSSSEWTVHNMRQYNLSILKPPVNNKSAGSSSSKASSMSYTSAAKSLDLLRQNLQLTVNQEIKAVISRYVDGIFKPGIENIKNNLGPDSVTEDHIQNMCRQILEEAKRMYPVYTSSSSPSSGISNSAIDTNDSDYQNSQQNSSSASEGVKLPLTSPSFGIKRESDTDSEASSLSNASKKLKKSGNNKSGAGGNPKNTNNNNNNNSSTSSNANSNTSPNKPKKPSGPSRKHVAQWDANKLTPDTLFIMGAKANKALGFAQTRGRLYVKHPGLFKYASDSDDKEWLSKNKLMPATGGRAYIMLLEDIEKLARDNKLNVSINYEDIKGFRVPDFILNKMKSYINTWKKQYAEEAQRSTAAATNRNRNQNQHQSNPVINTNHGLPPMVPPTTTTVTNSNLTTLNPPPPPTLPLSLQQQHNQQLPSMQQQQQQHHQNTHPHSQASLNSYHLSGNSPANVMYEPTLMPLGSAPQQHELQDIREYIQMEKRDPPMYPGHSSQQQPPQQHTMPPMQNPNTGGYVHQSNHLEPLEQALKGDWSTVSDRSFLQYALQSSRNIGSWDPQDSFDLIDSVTNGSLTGGGNSPLLQISADAGAHLTAPMGPVSPNCELSAVLDQAFQYTDT